MREFVKGTLIVCFLVSAVAAPFAWIDDRPSTVTWILRIGAPFIALTLFLLFLAVHFQRDRAPDFLHQKFGGYLDRGGLCFAFDAVVEDAVCYLRVHFQNRYSGPCEGRIVLRPARGFFLTRSSFQHVAFDIECPGAGYGVAEVPIPVRQEFQGKKQEFEVGASVRYPRRRGRMLRFREGGVIRANSDFFNPFGTALTLAGTATGQIVLSTPASVTLTLPSGVAEELPPHLTPRVEILWQPDEQHSWQSKSAN
jgi:hypothetical protein